MDNHQNPRYFEHDQKQRSQKKCIFDAAESGDGSAVNLERLDLQDCVFFLQNHEIMSGSTGKQPIIDQHHQQQLCPQVGLAEDISTADSDDLKKRFPETSNSISLDSCARKRKRENDRAYRERCKANVIQLKYNLAILGEENIQLKENETLERENASVNHRMQIQSTELDGLKKEFQKLNLENQKESVLVQVLSDLFVPSPDLLGEHHQLVNENIMLKQNTSADLVRMVEENVKLIYENRMLSTNKDALCAKLVVTEGDKIDN